MELEQAQILEETLTMLIDIEIRKNYSGRGMFGKETSAIVVNSYSEFIEAIGDFLADADTEEIKTINEIGKLLKNLHTDNMGMSIIIY